MALLVLIFVMALPLFLIAPRAGSAALTRSGGGLSHFIGFSENVTLGEIGSLKQDDGLVMRVRIEDSEAPDLLDGEALLLMSSPVGHGKSRLRQEQRYKRIATEVSFNSTVPRLCTG